MKKKSQRSEQLEWLTRQLTEMLMCLEEFFHQGRLETHIVTLIINCSQELEDLI